MHSGKGAETQIKQIQYQYLPEELFRVAGLKAESCKCHEQITKLGSAVVVTLFCVVLVGTLEISQTLSGGLNPNKHLS